MRLTNYFLALLPLLLLADCSFAQQQQQRRKESTVTPGVQIKTTPLKDELPTNVELHADVVYAEYGERKMKLDLFVPKGLKSAVPGLLIVHGGGWLKGDKSKFRVLAQTLASRGYVTAAVGYRLGGEAKFPAAIHDCNAATRWLRANAGKYNVDPVRIGAVGGSAGGHLVGLMATAPHVEQFQGEGGNPAVSSELQAAIVMAGPMELATGPVAEKSRKNPEASNSNKWLGKTIDEAPELYKLASPFTHASAKTPPMLFQVGQFDLPQRNVATRNKLREHGVRADIKTYFYGKHGCWNRRPWFDMMIDDMDVFFGTELKYTNAPLIEAKSAARYGMLVATSNRVEIFAFKSLLKGRDSIYIPRLTTPIKTAYLKDDEKKTPLKFRPEVREWRITLPKEKRETGARIIVETVGRSRVLYLPQVITEGEAGVTLPAHHAMTFGQLLRYEPQPHKNTIGYWANEKDFCEWHFYVDRPGKFDLHILQGCGKDQGGSKVAVQIGKQRVTFEVEDTGHFQNFKDRKVGQVELEPGNHKLTIVPIKKAKVAVMDVRQVRLVRQKTSVE